MGDRVSGRPMPSSSFAAILSGVIPDYRSTRCAVPDRKHLQRIAFSRPSCTPRIIQRKVVPPRPPCDERLLHKLRQVADTKGDERIVLFADEAQNLHELHYEWLRDLHDELESNGFRLF